MPEEGIQLFSLNMHSKSSNISKCKFTGHTVCFNPSYHSPAAECIILAEGGFGVNTMFLLLPLVGLLQHVLNKNLP